MWAYAFSKSSEPWCSLTAAEEIGINRLLDKYRPRSIPGNELQELYAEIGLQPPGPRHHADKLGPTSGD